MTAKVRVFVGEGRSGGRSNFSTFDFSTFDFRLSTFDFLRGGGQEPITGVVKIRLEA